MLPRGEAIKELGLGLYKTSLKSIYRIDEREEVRKEIQTALLSIPGHAEYYRDKIEGLTIPYLEAEAAWKKTEENIYINGKDAGLLFSELDRGRMWALQTLRELPSPETLRVLGEMFDDERMLVRLLPDKSNQEMASMSRPTSELSARTLCEMIENPPTKGDWNYDRDMPVWRNWWRQVKEGRRTVRFKGDPQEYDFTGPVREAKNPDVPRVAKRPHVHDESLPNSGKVSSSVRTSWIAGAIAALLAIVGWFFVRRKQAV